MTSWQLLRALETALRPWVEAQKGALSIAHDIDSYLEMLANSPMRWRAILGFEREEGFGEVRPGVGGLVHGQFFATVQMAKDFSIRTGDDLHRSRTGEPSILVRSDELVARLRGCVFPADRTDVDHDYGFTIISREWVERADEARKLLHRSLQARLQLGYTLPDPVPVELAFAA